MMRGIFIKNYEFNNIKPLNFIDNKFIKIELFKKKYIIFFNIINLIYIIIYIY